MTDRTRPSLTLATTARGAAADALLPRSAPTVPRLVGAKELFRAGAVPFEMVNDLSFLETIGSLVYLQAGFFFPGKIFRFPVFVSARFHQRVAIDFSLTVRLHL